MAHSILLEELIPTPSTIARHDQATVGKQLNENYYF